MALSYFDKSIHEVLISRLEKIEDHLKCDAVFYYGALYPGSIKSFTKVIEDLKKEPNSKETLTIILNTPGGMSEAVEKMVDIIRHNYKFLYIIVPDFAMSAGTIFCMATDKIYMDYTSSLGPIDPQVFNGKLWVPALGYLDQVDKMLKKAAKGELTDAEYAILQGMDLALLSQFEQAKNLTVTLLKDWLVKYKFKDWSVHASSGLPVTDDDKKNRAEEVAQKLGSNTLWHSHGRMIGIDKLESELRLKIEDYSNDNILRDMIRCYNDLITEYILQHGLNFFLHSKIYF